jgi:hypothetical protein
MGIPIVEGRDFAVADVTGGPVVLVNEDAGEDVLSESERHRPGE